MAEQKALYIDGNWVTTADTVVNTNPSDTNDVIGEYAQASSEHVNNALAPPTARWANGGCLRWRRATRCSWPLVTS